MKKILPIIALFALAGCSSAAGSTDSGTTRLEDAYAFCKHQHSAGTLDLEDDGHSLIIATGSTGNVNGVICTVASLVTPDRIVNQMDTTNALMGRQHEEADGLTYEWSYHPDNGLDLVITDQ